MATKDKKQQINIKEEVQKQLKAEEAVSPAISIPVSANPAFTPPPQSTRYDDADREFMPNRNDQIFSPNQRMGYSGGMGMGPSRPGFPMRGTGDRILDELLAGVPANDGYYLKLYKELRPNDFELKMRIDHYENWSDMEWEVNEIVRAYTAKQGPQRWGSGRYRIIIYREGGMRGPRFKPIDFNVDAQEPNQVQGDQQNSKYVASESIKDQMQSMAEMMKVVQQFNQPANPDKIHETIVSSMKSGADLAVARETANATVKSAEIQSNAAQQNQLVALMGETIRSLQNKPQDTSTAKIIEIMMAQMNEMTRAQLNKPADNTAQVMLAEVLKVALNKPEKKDDSMEKFLIMADKMGMFKQKEDSIDMMIKFKQAGLIPDPVKPETNTIEKMVDSFQKMLPLAKAMLGKDSVPGELPSVWPDVIKSVAPSVAKTVGDVVGTAREYYRTKQMEIGAARYVQGAPVGVGGGDASGNAVGGGQPQVVGPVNRPQDRVVLVQRVEAEGFAKKQPANYDEVDLRVFGSPAGEASEYELDPNIFYGPSASARSGMDARTEVDPRSVSMNGGYVSTPQEQVRQPVYAPPEAPLPRPPRVAQGFAEPSDEGRYTKGQVAQEDTGGGNSVMLPFVKEMQNAVMANDKNYYETLREFIVDNTSEDKYAGLLDGRIMLDQVLNKYRLFTGAWIIGPQAKQYFTEFLAWLRSQQVFAECQQCGEGLIFNSRREFEMNNLCGSCQIPMVESVVR